MYFRHLRSFLINIVSVIGTRPQYIKFDAIRRAFNNIQLEHNYIDTGQHYSPELSANLRSDLGIPEPIVNLEIGSGAHAVQTSRILTALDKTFTRNRPDAILVYGDTNSTLGASLVASKLHIPIAHVEAGLRSGNRKMPEEINRVVVDHISDRLYAPTMSAFMNLENEGLRDRSLFTGDIMVETLKQSLMKTPELPSFPSGPYFLATFHRAENVESQDRIREIIQALGALPEQVVLIAHPRLRDALLEMNLSAPKNLVILSSQNHSTVLSYLSQSCGVITDSGGLQKEAYILGKLCTTLRSDIEWVETLTDGWNILCRDLTKLSEMVTRRESSAPKAASFGDGNSSQLIVRDICSRFC